MQTFLFRRRSTASGNGMGTRGRRVGYKRSGGAGYGSTVEADESGPAPVVRA